MRHIESQHQIALVKWCSFHPILGKYLFHPANEGKRTFFQGALMKKQGVRAGVSDLFLAYPAGRYHGCWLELKSPIGASKLTEHQRHWMVDQHALNYCIGVCRGIDDGIEYLSAYLASDEKTLIKFRREVVDETQQVNE